MTALGLVAVLAAAVAVIAASLTGPRQVVATPHEIHVVDGPDNNHQVRIDSTLYVPAGVTAAHPAPAVILAHGFGQDKTSVHPDAEKLAQHGYVVLTYSARGFGNSTGQIALDSPDYEGKDVHGLVSWLGHQREVQQDGADDPRVGMTGGSYGGAMAMIAAANDRRIDAIVPLITWNSLASTFFPNAADPGQPGVFAKAWAGLFFGGQSAPGRTCGRFSAAICALYQHAAATEQPTKADLALLARSSPAGVLNRIHAPTLLIQGETDSLFGLDQARANARGIAAAGTPVRLAWYAGGHSAGTNLAETSRVRSLTLSWFNHWLRGGPDPGRSFTFSQLPNDSLQPQVYTADGEPGRVRVALHGPAQPVSNPVGGSPAAVSSIPGLPGGPLAGNLAHDIPGQSATFGSMTLDHAVTVVGGGTVRVDVASNTGTATLFGKLYDQSPDGSRQLPGGLVAPFKASGTVTVRLPWIEHRFAAGHRLVLVLASTDLAYDVPRTPATYRISVAGDLNLPTQPAHEAGAANAALPWAIAALALAVLGVSAIGLAGRIRRRRGAPDPSLVDVPLVVDGLRKAYGTELVAVDNLSFRVEREQILGLLGPNGAGKTTTLRMLMGLIRPSAGTLRVFGETIRPGAAVLTRVGAFVEGPGTLPHLSGLANLQLYWRATGRPESEAHAAEALEIAGLGDAVHRKVRSYSHGMRQRLAIAQAMLGLPDLLVLDEPTNGLDPPQIRALRDVLRRYATDGRTVVVSSHLLAEVEQTCTNVIVMDRGRLVAAGAVEEIVGASTTLSVQVDQPERAATVLFGLSGVDSIEQQGTELVVRLGDATAAQVVAALSESGLAISAVAPRRRLEDAFVSLIGER